jgi:hypothetical protein
VAPTDPRDLYGLPLERFTEERNALAKRLRQAGRRDEAADVSKLRKPSVAAWAVNQLVRTQGRELGSLLEAGDALQRAQEDVLGRRADAGALRGAADAEREALDRLTAKARGLLSSEGHELAQTKLEQVSETLHAAAIDDQARAEVRDGCLVRELRHVGLGALGAGAGASAAPKQRAAPRKPAEDKQAAKLKAAARQAEAAARRALERAERAVEVAAERQGRAVQALEEAEQALAAARERAEAARSEHDRAQRELEKL